MPNDASDEIKVDAKCGLVTKKNYYFPTFEHARFRVHCGVAESFFFLPPLHHPSFKATKPLNETVFKQEHWGNRAESGTLPKMSQICFLFTS